MPKRDRWRKAFTISVLVHCLLIAGAGWLGGGLLRAAQVLDLIEVELISDTGRSEQKAAAAVTPAVSAARAFARTAASADRSVVVTEMASEAVTEGFAVPTAGATGNSDAAVAGSGLPAAAGGAVTPKRIAAPRLLSKTDPQYPEEARRAGAEGTVTVRIEVKENGQPGEIAVVRSSGRESLDAAAVEAVRSWRFVPAQEAETGRAVRCFTTIPVIFRLRT